MLVKLLKELKAPAVIAGILFFCMCLRKIDIIQIKVHLGLNLNNIGTNTF